MSARNLEVRLLEQVPESEIVVSWLRSEIDSPRFSEKYIKAMGQSGLDKSLVLDPDLSNKTSNKARKTLLVEGSRNILQGFPWESTDWWQIAIETREELSNLYTIFGATWLAFTDGRRRLELAADFIASLPQTHDPHKHTSEIQAKMRAGEKIEPGILVTSAADLSQPLAILEGNVRSIAFFLSDDTTYPLNYYVGISEKVSNWGHCLDTLEDIRQAFKEQGKEYS